MSMTKADLPTVTPEHEAFCKGLWDKYDVADSAPYEPWRTDRVVTVFPGAVGGGNWGGVTFNPPLGLIITNIHNTGQWGKLEPSVAGGGRGRGRGGPPDAAAGPDGGPPPGPGGAASAQGAGRGGGGPQGGGPGTLNKRTPEGGRFWDPNKRWSCAPPPWGELVAVNANTGDIAWRVPLGAFDELNAKGIKTGTPQLGGAISTAGNLVFIGATIDSKFRAFDARTGAELWTVPIDAPAHSVPSTYTGRDGKQYIVVAAGGRGFLGSPPADTLIAYALP
jgi:quinoprotein glucose dehydrogenase